MTNGMESTMAAKPNIERERWQEMDDEQLVTACIGPLLARLRGASGKDKAAAYRGLSPERQDIFMLRVLDGHARGSAWEYYAWTGLLLQSPDQWAAILAALRRIGSLELLEALADTAAVHRKRIGPNAPGADASELREADGPAQPLSEAKASDLDNDPGLAAEIAGLYELYRSLVPEAYKLAAESIRREPQAYLSHELS
ncbi:MULTISPECIES: hypothetical protein [unclassified Paenibacillus]|uniref:hypothetical protein n=1 Tax=unclassified Paenibacillus TaxID=185978 RepID=UPI000956257F|nr:MULTISPECIES: hypothetical protein [unclassified Paenibacillus]ASS68084.2 hypothetical protein CIC07_19570 [Paenibacillus sp. RUD330]SIR39467.1 hypothetical protein SAMN05880555_3635 [Paenibacillus sp. RU4X]SIR49905.1 hypothetical protein SAMN05880570_3636 [Paenibacillus sp. RU4T]